MKKTMKNIGVFILAVLVLTSIVLSGCGTKQPGQTSAKSSDSSGSTTPKYVIKLALHVPESYPAVGDSREFAKRVAELTHNQVKIEVYPNGELGQLPDIVEGVKQGTLQMGWGDLGTIGNFYPRANVIGLPFLFRDFDQVHKFFDGPLGQKLAREIRQNTGIRILGYSDSGFRDIVSKKPIRSIADMKGLKIRVPSIPIYVDTMKALGASPTPIAASEMYTSLQTGVVDAMECPPQTIWDYKMQEVTKYLSITHHIFTDYDLLINNKYFSSLPKDIQDAITKAAKECVAKDRQELDDNQVKYEDKLAQKLTKANITDANMKGFKDAVKPVWDNFAAKYKAQDLIDGINAIK
ncbi:2,3-diketo-L-gulonate-binding periplasmic protein YiaO precursor [Peptococcaceae bacterium CEB3]|nr:2,3-diketo-L-gulonate-binding periplasmic protein YiaO precursor [Peptococcaceae bacterium CEB3]